MKTSITRISLMTLALLTSLTAVGQVTVLETKKFAPPGVTFDKKNKSSEMKDLKKLDNKSDGKSLDKQQVPDRGLLEKGGVNGGGGSFATVDGKTVLSDRYYKKIGKPQTFERAFPKELRNYIQATLHLLNAYGIDTAKFYLDTIAASDNLYIFVTKAEFAQVKCDHYLPPLDRPASAHVQFGCTKAKATYLVSEDFEADSILELALGVIHERLWTQQPNVDQRFIADFTTVLGKLKSKQDDQIFREDRQALTDDEMDMFEDLEIAARQLGFWSPSNLKASILQQGGGRKIGSVMLDKNSFVGIGSSLFGFTGTTVEIKYGGGSVRVQNSVILASNVKNSTIANSTVIQSKLNRLILESSDVKSSDIQGIELFHLDIVQAVKIQFAQVANSTLNAYSLQGTAEQGQGINVLDSNLYGGNFPGTYIETIGAGTQIVKTIIENGSSIGSNVELTNITYEAAKGKSSESRQESKYHMAGIKVASNSVMQNLNYTFEYKHSPFTFGDAKFEVDTKGQIVDFGGKQCTSTDRKLKLETANDLLQHCQ